jgi:hypothetical protein
MVQDLLDLRAEGENAQKLGDPMSRKHWKCKGPDGSQSIDKILRIPRV